MQILETLQSKLTYIKSNRRHYIFRCPFCGDSQDTTHGHLYVAIDKPVFRCVRCGVGGHLFYLLKELNLEKDINIEDFYDTSLLLSNVSLLKNISFNLNTEQHEDFIKDYIKQRIGIDTILPEFNILSYKTYYDIVKNRLNDTVFDKGICFLTYYRKRMVLRVLDDIFYRYYNYSLGDGNDTYIINNNIDIVKFRQHKTVVIAEGAFDILNVYVHRYINIPDSAIFAAALTSTFTHTYKIVRALTLCNYPNLIIVADNDKDDANYLKGLRYNGVKILRNKINKDFGEYDKVEPYISFEKQSS